MVFHESQIIRTALLPQAPYVLIHTLDGLDMKPKTYPALLVVLIIAVACSRDKGPYLVEIVGLNHGVPHDFSLQIKEMSDSPDVLALQEDKLIFLADTKIFQNDLASTALDSHSFDELRDRLQSNLGGKKLEVLFTRSTGVYRATTFDSLLVLSALYHFDKIIGFAKSHNLLQAPADQNPLRVGIYGEIYTSRNKLVPSVKNDNATYVGSADTIVLLPLGLSEGLPMSMNDGILAHEYHHRIFFNQVWVNGGGRKLWKRYQARYDADNKVAQSRSHILLSATDEGLADVFAVAFTGAPDFLAASLTGKRGKALNIQRDLKGPFARRATYDDLAFGTLHRKLRGLCPAKSQNFENPDFNIYCLGTVIAKVFYEAAEQNIGILRKHALPIIHKALLEVGQELASGQEYDVDIFFEAVANMAKQQNPSFHKRLCEQLTLRFKSLIDDNKVSSCSSI